MQHGGYIALHLAAPLALSLSILAVDLFSKLMAQLDKFVRSSSDIDPLDDLRQERLSIINLHSRWTLLLLLFIAVGALCSTVVLLQVIDPARTYGNDVFNASRYPYGYYTANIYLALTWTVIFPVSLFWILQITTSMVVILGKARRQSLLIVDLLHPDNCGGLSPFGDLNMMLMAYYLPPFLAMLALAETHARKYTSLVVPALVLSLVFIAQSFIAVYSIRAAISAEKKTRLATLHPILQHSLQYPLTDDSREITFLLWQHIRSVNTMPYASNIQRVVDFLRYVPPLLALINFAHIIK